MYATPTASTDVKVVQKFETADDTPTDAEYPVHIIEIRTKSVTTVLNVTKEKSKWVMLAIPFKLPL